MPEWPVRIVVVCEAAADQRTACGLADRVFRECVIEGGEFYGSPPTLAELRTWSGLDVRTDYLAWRDVRKKFDECGLAASRVHGRFRGEPGAPDASAARRALALVTVAAGRSGELGGLDGVILVRDSDGTERARGLRQARDEYGGPLRIVIGVAHPKRECWILAAIDGNDEPTAKILKGLRSELGFDARVESHRLTASGSNDKRSAKRVLGRLCSPTDEQAVLDSAALRTIRDRGRQNGLADYLTEIEERLVPLMPS